MVGDRRDVAKYIGAGGDLEVRLWHGSTMAIFSRIELFSPSTRFMSVALTVAPKRDVSYLVTVYDLQVR